MTVYGHSKQFLTQRLASLSLVILFSNSLQLNCQKTWLKKILKPWKLTINNKLDIIYQNYLDQISFLWYLNYHTWVKYLSYLKRKNYIYTYNQIKLTVVFVSNPVLRLELKNPIFYLDKSCVVYRSNCFCERRCIGQTSRHLKTKIKYHLPKSQIYVWKKILKARQKPMLWKNH